MDSAIARFRSRMGDANRAFITAGIAGLHRQPISDEEKLEMVSGYWFSDETLSQSSALKSALSSLRHPCLTVPATA